MSDALVIGVSGSRRDESVTRIALEEHLADGVEREGGEFELLDLAELSLPPLDPDADTPPDAELVKERLQAADAVALGTPMYHGSYSGVLKNALDYTGFDEFEDTTVGLLCVAGGGFPTPPLNHLRDVCRSLNAWVVPHQVAIPNSSSNAAEGELEDDGLVERTETLGEKLVQFRTITPAQESLSSRENKGA